MSDDWPDAGTLLACRYRLVTRLEIGGMAEIWHAQDELLARPVALKLPTGSDRAHTDVLRLAWKEARMGARLSHPNIAAVHDYDEAVRPSGSVAPFVVMELLAGETLAARLVRRPLSWREAAAIGSAVAGALTAAHASGVVHRDVKPGNVMLTPTGIKILDFGISAVTGEPDDDETGVTFGTPAYVAPERLDGQPAEPATDVYGLGVLLFEMVTGQPPYPVDTWEELALARAGDAEVLPSTLPQAFRDLVARCLAAEPRRRPTAAGVGDALAELVAPDAAERAGPPPQRQPAVDPPHEPAGEQVRKVLPDGGRAQPRSGPRRLVLWSSLVALVVSVLALFAALGSSRQTAETGRFPAASPPRTSTPPTNPLRTGTPPPSTLRTSTPSPSTLRTSPPPPSTLRTSSPPPSPPASAPAAPAATATATAGSASPVGASAPLDAGVALTRVSEAVSAGRDQGQIRPDVAVDLLNMLQSLGIANKREVDDRLAELRRKLRERVDEGSVAATRAEILRVRLTELDQAMTAG